MFVCFLLIEFDDSMPQLSDLGMSACGNVIKNHQHGPTGKRQGTALSMMPFSVSVCLGSGTWPF